MSRVYRWFCNLPAVLQGLVWLALFAVILVSGRTLWNGDTDVGGAPEASGGKGSASVYENGYSITKTVLANHQIMLEVPGFGPGTEQDTLLKNCQVIVQRIMAGGQAPTGFHLNPDEWYGGCTDALDEWFAEREQ